jgi:DNA repair photolyase
MRNPDEPHPGEFAGCLPGFVPEPSQPARSSGAGTRLTARMIPRVQRARSAAPLHQKGQAEYRPLFVDAVLNENQNKSLPFYWTINPYRGCEFGCGYCFARYTHQFLEHRGVDDFERRIYVKLGAGEALRESLRPGMLRGRPIALGTATDPYQPAELRFGITRSILETLAGCPDLELSITTKSPLVLRDLDLLLEISRRRPLQVNISLTTLNHSLSRILEGRSPSPRRRIDTLRRLAGAGIPTAVFVMPILPGITDHPQDLLRLLRVARAAGAEEAHGGSLHLEGPTRNTFLPLVRRHFPHLWNEYQRWYAEGRLAPETLRQEHQRRFAEARELAGFPGEPPARAYEPTGGEQLTLAACAPGRESGRRLG